jgi:hypothetical protein
MRGAGQNSVWRRVWRTGRCGAQVGSSSRADDDERLTYSQPCGLQLAGRREGDGLVRDTRLLV